MPGCSLLSAFHNVAGGCQQLNTGAVQNQASFKATCVCILWHFVTFRDSFHHFSNPCVWWWATDAGQSTHDVLCLRRSLNFIKHPSEERPRFVHTILAWKVLGRSLGRMRGWWEHRKFDQQLWLRISLAVSSWKDWLFVSISFLGDLSMDDLGLWHAQITVDIFQKVGISSHKFLPSFL